MQRGTHKDQNETGPTLLELLLRLEGDIRRCLEPNRVTPLQAGVLLFLRRHAEARATRRLSSAYSRRKSYKRWKGWRADPGLDYRSSMASRVPIAAIPLRTRIASKRGRNSLMECIHLLYTNRTAESAFRQTRMSPRSGADYVPRMRGAGRGSTPISRTVELRVSPAVATINADHATLKHMFSIAERLGLVLSNAAKKIPLPDPGNERDRVLNPDEWNRLYSVAPDHLKPILLIAFQLGMRWGEIMSLTWDCVDLQWRFLRVLGAKCKTGEGRTIPLTPEIKDMFVELAKVRHLSTNHVFLYEGQPVQRVKRSFMTACRKVGIKDLRFHDLRHCAATNLRRAGVDTVTAMKIVGHRSEKMHRRYNSVSEEDLAKAAGKLNSYLYNTNRIFPPSCICKCLICGGPCRGRTYGPLIKRCPIDQTQQTQEHVSEQKNKESE
jgi:integrase